MFFSVKIFSFFRANRMDAFLKCAKCRNKKFNLILLLFKKIYYCLDILRMQIMSLETSLNQGKEYLNNSRMKVPKHNKIFRKRKKGISVWDLIFMNDMENCKNIKKCKKPTEEKQHKTSQCRIFILVPLKQKWRFLI